MTTIWTPFGHGSKSRGQISRISQLSQSVSTAGPEFGLGGVRQSTVVPCFSIAYLKQGPAADLAGRLLGKRGFVHLLCGKPKELGGIRHG